MLGFVGALRPGAFRKRRGVDTGLWQCAGQLLTPMRHFATWGITIDKPHGGFADVRELMEGVRRHIGHLSTVYLTDFVVDAELTLAFEDEIHLLLVMVVPGHLTAHRIERDMTHTEICGFDG